MRLIIDGTADEIQKVLQAIKGDQEHQDLTTRLVFQAKALYEAVQATPHRKK